MNQSLPMVLDLFVNLRSGCAAIQTSPFTAATFERKRATAGTRKSTLGIEPILSDMLIELCQYTDDLEGHCERVALYADRIAQQFDFTRERLEHLSIAAALHDYGKLGVPLSILMKEGPLTGDERSIIECHPIIGAKLLAKYEHAAFRMAATVSLSHHEAWDGSGYPFGLSGDRIPIEGRIVSVCDAFDALTSDRCYRPAVSNARALAILKEDAGTKFDPKVVEAFSRVAPI